MLVIPRRKNQSIVISDSIIVNVVEVEGDEVQLSIDYPEGVSVQPGEVVAERELAVKEPVAV
jgi:carbon storage regulator